MSSSSMPIAMGAGQDGSGMNLASNSIPSLNPVSTREENGLSAVNVDNRVTVQSIFSTTSCYELMQVSNKVP